MLVEPLLTVFIFSLQMNWSEKGATGRNSLPADPDDVSMTDNSLYSGKEAGENMTSSQT